MKSTIFFLFLTFSTSSAYRHKTGNNGATTTLIVHEPVNTVAMRKDNPTRTETLRVKNPNNYMRTKAKRKVVKRMRQRNTKTVQPSKKYKDNLITPPHLQSVLKRANRHRRKQRNQSVTSARGRNVYYRKKGKRGNARNPVPPPPNRPSSPSPTRKSEVATFVPSRAPRTHPTNPPSYKPSRTPITDTPTITPTITPNIIRTTAPTDNPTTDPTPDGTPGGTNGEPQELTDEPTGVTEVTTAVVTEVPTFDSSRDNTEAPTPDIPRGETEFPTSFLTEDPTLTGA